jgi:hypothetical protein
MVPPQKPSDAHMPPQHWLAAVQAAPSGAHMVPPQKPPVHCCA